MARPRALSPQRLAEQFVDAQEQSIYDMIDRHMDGWNALVDRLRPSWRGALSLAERVAMANRLRAALPKDLHLVLRDLCDAYGAEEGIATETAFLVGVEVGRRRKGAA